MTTQACSTKAITIDQIMEIEPCMSAKEIKALVGDQPLTIDTLDVLDIPALDKIWLLCHEGFIPAKELRLFACDIAEQSCKLTGVTNEYSLNAIAAARRYAVGEATDKELAAAWDAAWDAARDAAWDAARAAASDAARDLQNKRLTEMLLALSGRN